MNAKIAVALVLAAALAGCSNNGKSASSDSGAATASAVNTTCPFSGGKANQNITVAYGEKNVAFCCNGCKGKFEAMSNEQKDALLAKAK